MKETNYSLVLLLGFILAFIGLLSLIKADKWVMLLIESWPFRDFSALEIKLMRIAWRIGGIALITFGIWIIIKR